MKKTIRGGKGIMMAATLMLEVETIANELHNGNFSRAVETLCSEAIEARKATEVESEQPEVGVLE